MWHYVALNTYQQNSHKYAFFPFLTVTLCGTMWHYVALYGTKYILTKSMQNNILGFFFYLWHYVALCDTMIQYALK